MRTNKAVLFSGRPAHSCCAISTALSSGKRPSLAPQHPCAGLRARAAVWEPRSGLVVGELFPAAEDMAPGKLVDALRLTVVDRAGKPSKKQTVHGSSIPITTSERRMVRLSAGEQQVVDPRLTARLSLADSRSHSVDAFAPGFFAVKAGTWLSATAPDRSSNGRPFLRWSFSVNTQQKVEGTRVSFLVRNDVMVRAVYAGEPEE